MKAGRIHKHSYVCPDMTDVSMNLDNSECLNPFLSLSNPPFSSKVTAVKKSLPSQNTGVLRESVNYACFI